MPEHVGRMVNNILEQLYVLTIFLILLYFFKDQVSFIKIISLTLFVISSANLYIYLSLYLVSLSLKMIILNYPSCCMQTVKISKHFFFFNTCSIGITSLSIFFEATNNIPICTYHQYIKEHWRVY